MSKQQGVLALVCAVVLTGCSSTGPLFKGLPPIPEKQAQLVYFRPHNIWNAWHDLDLSENGERLCAMSDQSYFVHNVDPGTLVVSCEPHWYSDGRKRLWLNPGERWFIKMMFGNFSGPSVHPVLKFATEEEAMSHLKYCRAVPMIDPDFDKKARERRAKEPPGPTLSQKVFHCLYVPHCAY